MANIVQFEVNGLGGRKKSIKRSLRETTVFWGVNGSGKTSLLKILHSALLDDATPLIRVPFTSARVVIDAGGDVFMREITKRELRSPSVVRRLERARELAMARGQVYYGDLGEDINAALPWNTTGNGEPEEQEGPIQHGYLPISRVSETRRRGPRGSRPTMELVDEASFDKLFAGEIQRLWSDYNARALAQISITQELGLANVFNSVLAEGRGKRHLPEEMDFSEAFPLIKAFFSGQRMGRMVNIPESTLHKNYADSQLVRQVVTDIATVQQGIEKAQEPQRKIEQLLSDLYSGGKEVTLQGRAVSVSANGEAIPLESLSSGEKQMLQLLLETLAAGNAPVIIDEPELSLHVDWQRRLVDCMRIVNPDAQLIMATHSPEVMAFLPDSMISEL
ncbi:AAA family ATPase [Kribbella jiaozuonensis]|uniref:ATP-binding protein n=1 Tax=Kribbella jiaozuonensis TaxID=2575441 RepID=A0A4U3M5N5_9ACTN|nr:ATP-binding protein [Kribbella jiaozuonensis]TKK79154.1 ATP-binding protein [Kribbella jiaozuonensis]TKK83224.1 ATP-binding protein [Kribbella jiaozuonensis]